MMPSAAPQQIAPPPHPLVDLLATLPARSLSPAEVPELTAIEPPRGWSKDARRQRSLNMLSTALRRIRFNPAYGRTFAAAGNVLALVGLAALCGLVLPQQRDGLSKSLAFIGDPFSSPATVAEGPIQASAGETALEREQRAVTEFIAKRY